MSALYIQEKLVRFYVRMVQRTLYISWREKKKKINWNGLLDRSLNDKPIVPGRQNSRDAFAACLTSS